jgi:hypothetical protein
VTSGKEDNVAVAMMIVNLEGSQEIDEPVPERLALDRPARDLREVHPMVATKGTEATRSHTETGLRVAGFWLVIGSAMWVPALALHPPLPTGTSAFMERIAEAGTRWVVVHWLAAASLTIFALTSLIVLAARSRLTRSAIGMSAWALLPVGALWVSATAVVEATVISRSAISGDATRFEAWDAFAAGWGMGFFALALGVALIAVNELRTARSGTPVWASWIGAAGGVVGFASWLLGRAVLGFAIGGPLLVTSSVAMGVFLLWFGAGLARRPARAA